jgi:threonylcarbamoyladenosine tRNA methylthiotransferase MtaB
MSFKVAFHTLGCKVNYYESEALKGEFRRAGFEVVDFEEPADVYVINTCTVTHLAERKSRQIIRRAKRRNPAALVAVTGCYAQVSPEDISSLGQADLVTGTADRLALPELVRKKMAGGDVFAGIDAYAKEAVFEDLPWVSEGERTRAFLKIQDGCRQFCTYCIIPRARGPLRSLPLQKALAYLQEIGRSGYKEVVLTGIHLGLYGIDLQPQTDLGSFLERAAAVEGIERLRLSSVEPWDLEDKLLEVVKGNKKICRHLHIPLQSGDDGILKEMGRPYDASFYRGLLKRLRDALPDLAVSTDIMVGFPGESEEQFRRGIDFVRECAFSRLHVFKYSPRSGTKAASMADQVRPEIKEARSREMINLGKELARNFQEKFIGRRLDVLFEKVLPAGDERGEIAAGGLLEGLTSNYLRVRAPGPGNLRGQIREVLIKKNAGDYLIGVRLHNE